MEKGPTRGADGKRSAARPVAGSTIFKPNPFPYAVPDGTEHWVFWMAANEAEWPEARMRAVWAALVAGSANGYLPAGKFGPWMRSGEPSPERLTTIERRRIMAMRARRELDRETGRLVGFESEASARSVRPPELPASWRARSSTVCAVS